MNIRLTPFVWAVLVFFCLVIPAIIAVTRIWP